MQSSPLTFDIKQDIQQIIVELRMKLGVSASQVIREAISSFDFGDYQPEKEEAERVTAHTVDGKRWFSNIRERKRVDEREEKHRRG